MLIISIICLNNLKVCCFYISNLSYLVLNKCYKVRICFIICCLFFSNSRNRLRFLLNENLNIRYKIMKLISNNVGNLL